ncbi:MAG: alpha-2-macroglobulin family protein [Paracoccaceae bacterium]
MSIFRLALALALLGLACPAGADEQAYVPAKRFALTEDTDLGGTDIQSIFDTSIETCEQSCLADDRCVAMTFNSRASSCFLKSAVSGEKPYRGAYSGWVKATDAAVLAAAPARAGELSFLSPDDLSAALAQAQTLANDYIAGDRSAEELLAQARDARGAGNLADAARYVAAAVSLTDAPDQWADYAQLLLDTPAEQSGDKSGDAARALNGTVNAYLRAGSKGAQASALLVMARALEASGRGHDMIPALKLAQSLQPRDEADKLLTEAMGKYGFNIADNSVESDSANPRLCATFNGPLAASGVDYATFVQLPESGLSVDASDNQICVSGVQHGKRYSLTFRKGLPAADGETLAKDTVLSLYVRDRSPQVLFPGRAYILPRAGQAGIPVQTVNAAKLDLKLVRISDRNLVRTIEQDYFARPLDTWSLEDFNATYAEQVWKGSADLAKGDTNQDVTTNLPLDPAMKHLGPGIYALQATIPGTDGSQIAPAQQWFVISDLGLTTMTGTDGLHVFVRSLADASAREGVEVTLLSRANAIIATAKTDAQGYARFDAPLTAGAGSSAPAMVTVAAGDDFSFLSLTEPEFDLSDRGVTGREPAPAVDVFLATDRGAYRAGEALNATILARDAEMKGIEGLPLTVRLIRPDGVEYSRQLAPDAGGGGRAISLPIGGGAPRGTWRIEVFADDENTPLASAPFLVEDFLPERIDFALSLPDGPLPIDAGGDIAVSARYLFGAPGAGLAMEGDYRISAASSLDAFPGYSFGRYDQAPDPVGDSFYDLGTTDDQGNGTIPLPAPAFDPAPTQPLLARYAIRLAEGSGRPVERTIERTLLPKVPVIGIKPAFDTAGPAANSDAAFALIAVGPDGARTMLNVHWKLNRVQTDYQWYAVGGQWNWEPTTTRQRIAEGDTAVGADAPAQVMAHVEWGEYELVAETSDRGASASSVRFYAGGYVSADASQTPDTLDLTLDKPAYRPGDTAQIRLVPRAAGVALVTVISNHLIDMKAVEVKEGENIVTLPVTDAWGAGAYVTATALKPGNADAKGHKPARAIGLSYAAVDPGTRKLAATVEVADRADPRGPLPVAVKVAGVAPGETAWVTVAAVDQGILNLTAYQPPDPEGHYLGQQRLGMAIRDVYGRLIDSANGAPGTVRSGGDAGGVKLKAPPPTEELVAYFSGPLPVGADGYARTEFTLPSFNGTVKVMAVAWSKSAVGEASKDVLVHDPVVVTASVPRFLQPGDKTTLRLELVHAEGPSGKMGLALQAQGLTAGQMPASVDLADKGKATLSVPLQAPPGETGEAKLTVTLTTPDGKTLAKTLTIPVQANDPLISRQSQLTLAAGDRFTLDANVFAGLQPGTAHATVALGAAARFNAPAILATLDRYPYGCTEQLTSKALPLLYFDQMAQAMEAAGAQDVRDRVQQAIGQILLNQDTNGAFGLWYPESGDLWLDAYVTDFLSRARAQGYAVPDTAFRQALDNLHNQINYSQDFDKDGGPVAYALMVLAREGAAAIGDLRYYADVKAEAFDTPIAAAQLGAALAAYGDQTRADQMFRQAATLVAQNTGTAARPEAQVWRADYGTNLRDATALLALASEAGSKAFKTEDLGQMIAGQISGRSLSTQEATWALMATHALTGSTAPGSFTLDGAPMAGPWAKVSDGELSGGTARVIANTGSSPTSLTLTTFGVPSEPEPASGKGYKIDRRWYTLEGQEIDPTSVKQGTRMVAVLEITPLGPSAGRLMVSDPLPAGFEIDNPNLIRGGDLAALDWLTTVEDTRTAEFRQDRFLAAVDWTSADSFRLAYIVRAISPGTYHLPAASVEDMYRPDYQARTGTGTVTVTD